MGPGFTCVIIDRELGRVHVGFMYMRVCGCLKHAHMGACEISLWQGSEEGRPHRSSGICVPGGEMGLNPEQGGRAVTPYSLPSPLLGFQVCSCGCGGH